MKPILEIDLGQIAQNYTEYQNRFGTTVAAVLKGDAYGMGAPQVSKKLYKTGCRNFFVAYESEGLDIKPTLGPDANIYIFNGPDPDTIDSIIGNRLIPVLNTVEQIDTWYEHARNLPCAIHVFTGMGRYSVKPEELDMDKLREMNIKLIISHLSVSYDPTCDFNQKQFDNMTKIRDNLETALGRKIPISLTASNITRLPAQFKMDMIRVGGGLYNLSTPITLRTPIVQISKFDPGTAIGYGAENILTEQRTVATCLIGYGDGLKRTLANKGFGYIGDTRVNIIGSICMDLTMFDVTDVPTYTLSGAKYINIIQPGVELTEIAKLAGTSFYEILISLHGRIERVWIE